jgi:hypothetical protein
MNPTPRQIWQRFWGELNTPEGYRADWYPALTNQTSHAKWAAVAVCVICAIWALHYGEMPYRWPLWIIVTGLYAFLVEYLRQGWRRRDSFNDTYFIGLGAAAPLVSLHEVAYRPEIRLEFVGGGLGFLTWLAVAILSFAAHVVPRIVRQIKEGKS